MRNRAFCFDLSGTVTKEEIVPLLSKELGIYDEIQTLTDATVNGLIPPKKSFLLRSELVNQLNVSQSQLILSNIQLHPKIFNFIQKNHDHCFVITMALDAWIQKLMDKFSCDFYCSEAECENDKITKVKSILNKAAAIDEINEKFDEIVAIGGDMADVSMLERANISIAFAGVHDPVSSLIEESNFITFSEAGLCNILNTLL